MDSQWALPVALILALYLNPFSIDFIAIRLNSNCHYKSQSLLKTPFIYKTCPLGDVNNFTGEYLCPRL
ncbi:hypothetical protein XELAEV_18030241mg [Xenopus laevis]|uniref:Uncharacterized protein n=1 Tax=Xenopus laevis TaxID=8355 RepID=A0A974HIK9_XENLA|nr:hypothetical protein XELAEV_18030241mg [Xenopus laevis]